MIDKKIIWDCLPFMLSSEANINLGCCIMGITPKKVFVEYVAWVKDHFFNGNTWLGSIYQATPHKYKDEPQFVGWHNYKRITVVTEKYQTIKFLLKKTKTKKKILFYKKSKSVLVITIKYN